MSDEERLRRDEYLKARKGKIIWRLIIIAFVSLIAIISSITYFKTDSRFYINYDETSEVDYKVYLKENDFYEDPYLDKGQVYVASLIDHIETDFVYEMEMETENVNFAYSYRMDAQLEIIDEISKAPMFTKIYDVKDEVTYTKENAKNLYIREKASFDYDEYNDLATRYIGVYDLTNVTSNLKVNLYINVLSACDNFEKDASNEYVVSLSIPLTSQKVNIKMTSSIPTAGNKILACEKNQTKDIFEVIMVLSISLDIILLVALFLYMYISINSDVQYNLKKLRLLSNYKSYIQKIKNSFDFTNYQILELETFEELLEIHDTLQKPILMEENFDKTATNFFITGENSIVYLYEIRVPNYDDIYGDNEETIIE